MGRQQFPILSNVIQISLFEKVTFEQRLDEGKRANHGAVWKKVT